MVPDPVYIEVGLPHFQGALGQRLINKHEKVQGSWNVNLHVAKVLDVIYRIGINPKALPFSRCSLQWNLATGSPH